VIDLKHIDISLASLECKVSWSVKAR
jgi:hypothetical protein